MCLLSIIQWIGGAKSGVVAEPPPPTATRHTGIFTPNVNQTLYYGSSTDFNAVHGVAPGDEVEIPAGTYDYFEAFIISGVKFVVTGGQAVFKSFSCKVGSQNIEIDGISESGVAYGIKTSHAGSFGALMQTVGTLTIKGWESDGNAMGIQVSHNPVETYPLNYLRLIIEDCKMINTGNEGEGFYIGHDTLSLEVLMDIRIRHNYVENTGRDGIQMRNCSYIICENNEIHDTGRGGDATHSHGILIGGNTQRSLVRNNTGDGITGNAIFINGSGDVVCENNTLECIGVDPLYGIYVNNYASTTADLQNVDYLKVYMINNDINPVNSAYWFVTNVDIAKDPVSVYLSGNTMHGKINFLESGTVTLEAADYDPFVETWAYTYGS